MKILNLAELSKKTSAVRKRKTLSDIVAEINQSTQALNPFTIAAEKIVKRLNDQLLFPYLQPNVVNPLDDPVDLENPEDRRVKERYLRGEAFDKKFPEIRYAKKFGMSIPAGIVLCTNEKSNPHFLNEDDLVREKGNIDYQVYDLTSLQTFLARLIPDMSFLHPMKRNQIFDQKGKHAHYNPKPGDIVVIPGQKYGKLGVVAQKTRKDYLALLQTEDGFHIRNIGVNTTELGHNPHDLERICNSISEPTFSNSSSLHLVSAERLLDPERLPKGMSAVLLGYSEYTKLKFNPILEVHQSPRPEARHAPIGLVTVVGYDADCAVILPYPLNKNEIFPWGSLGSLAIPTDQLAYLGSPKDASQAAEVNQFFLNNLEAARIVNSTAMEVLGDKVLESLTSFSCMRRYGRLLEELRSNSNIPPNIVSSQFISILTSAKLDGLENLARIAGENPVNLAVGLLQEDSKNFDRTVGRGEEKYGTALEEIGKIVRRTTKFKSVEEMLINVSPKIKLYSLPRDGVSTLALIDEFQLLVSRRSEELYRASGRGDIDEDEAFGGMIEEVIVHGKRKETSERKPFSKSDKLLDKVDVHQFMQSAWRMIELQAGENKIYGIEDIPDDKVRINDIFESYCLTGIMLSIPVKNTSIRYGRNRNFELEYPQLSELEKGLVLDQFASSAEIDFMDRVVNRIKLYTEFDGQRNFVASYLRWRKRFDRKERDAEKGQDNYEYLRSMDFESRMNSPEWLMKEIQPLYEAIKQLTRNAQLREQIVSKLFEGQPILREAYYDYEYMQMTIAVRDHFWRGNLSEKYEFMRNHGYYDELSDNGFADEWYHELSKMDLFHRGFTKSERDIIDMTRNRTMGYRHGSHDTQSMLGYTASPQADKLLAGIESRMQQIGNGKEMPGLLMLEQGRK